MSIVLTAFTGLGVVALLALLARKSSWAFAAKALASLGFVALALSRHATGTRYGWLILIGLGLGLAGDLLVEWRSPAGFLLGLGAFLAGHLAYLTGFSLEGPDWRLAGLSMGALLVAGIGVAVWLHLHLPASLVAAVRTYIVVIVVMTAVGLGLFGARPLASIGALAFFLSDLAVARERFVHPAFVNQAWGLPLYYLGQILIAWSI
jgi:uncharacterized membrane protein YhhN